MADYRLETQTPLQGYAGFFGATRLTELPPSSMYALSANEEQRAALATALDETLSLELPSVGLSSTNRAGSIRLLGLQRGQWFLRDADGAELHDRLKTVCWPVDQSDSWVQLELEGAHARSALERLCPIDLHPQRFGIDRLARTLVEHMNATIVRTGDDAFLLLSARSTAEDFLHCLQTALGTVTARLGVVE